MARMAASPGSTSQVRSSIPPLDGCPRVAGVASSTTSSATRESSVRNPGGRPGAVPPTARAPRLAARIRQPGEFSSNGILDFPFSLRTLPLPGPDCPLTLLVYPAIRRSRRSRRARSCRWNAARLSTGCQDRVASVDLQSRRDAGAWRTKVKRAVLGLIIAASLLPGSLAAQAVTGTIIGVITDSSGAVMPGASVTLTNTGTGLTRIVITDSNGEYTAPLLPTGKYTVKAELSGFKTVTTPDVALGVDQKFRVNMRLEIGAVEESITVTGASPLVQTSSSELGTTVAEEQIKTLPLNGRNFVNLTRTVPGVVRGIPGANIDGAGSLAWRASASFSANGQRPRDNNYMLDGVDNNETWLQTVVLFPSVDALDEFKLQTSTYSAEFGRSLGGVVNIQIKSGTNAMHGSAFEFLRNDAFDANNYFNVRAGRPKPDFSQHQFGGTAGGPIVKDKTFYFFDYQGYRVNQGATYLSTVPSQKMRNGDFSEINRRIY